MADYIYQKLYPNVWIPPQGASLTLGTNVAAVASDYPVPAVRMSANRQVTIFGTLNVANATVGQVIATIPYKYVPNGHRVFACAAPSNGVAIVSVNINGEITWNGNTAAISYISLDTINYCGYDTVQW